jgi:hypothetical protein
MPEIDCCMDTRSWDVIEERSWHSDMALGFFLSFFFLGKRIWSFVINERAALYTYLTSVDVLGEF